MKPLMLPLTPPDSPFLVPILEVEEDNLSESPFWDAHLHGITPADTADFMVLPCKPMSPAPLYVPEILWLNKPHGRDRVALPPAPPPSPILSRPSPVPYCPQYEDDSTLGPWDPPSLPDSLKETPVRPLPLYEDPSSFLDAYCSSFEDDSWDEFEEPISASQRSSSYYSCITFDDTFSLPMLEKPISRPLKHLEVPQLPTPPNESMLSVPTITTTILKRNVSFDTAMTLREATFSLQRAEPPHERHSERNSSSSYAYSEPEDDDGEDEDDGPTPKSGWFRSLGARPRRQRPIIQRRASSPDTSDASSSRHDSIRRQRTEKLLGPLDRLFGGKVKKM